MLSFRKFTFVHSGNRIILALHLVFFRFCFQIFFISPVLDSDKQCFVMLLSVLCVWHPKTPEKKSSEQRTRKRKGESYDQGKTFLYVFCDIMGALVWNFRV